MRVWVLAGLFTVAMAPAAFAVEDTSACYLDETRRAMEPRAESAQATPPTVVRQTTLAERGNAEETPRQQPAERRRSVKRIPDAELIGPRGAL